MPPKSRERPTADLESEFMKLRLLGGQNYQHLDKGFFFFFFLTEYSNRKWHVDVIRAPSCRAGA